MVRTTSTSFISGTGLKKCNPINRSGRFTAVNNSVTEIEEVFEAKIASFFTIAIDRRIHLLLLFTFSMMASITMSQSARSALLVVPLSRARIASFCCRRDPALFDRPLGKLGQRLLNPGKALVEILLLDFKHSHIKPSRSANLRNAGTHQPTTENANFFNLHRKTFLR